MQLSRHAKNEMRLYSISCAEVAAVIAAPLHEGVDERGNRRLTGIDQGSRAIIVVIANDDPGFVITTFPED